MPEGWAGMAGEAAAILRSGLAWVGGCVTEVLTRADPACPTVLSAANRLRPPQGQESKSGPALGREQ